MNDLQISQLAKDFSSLCKETVRKSKLPVYTSPVVLTILTVIFDIGDEISKDPPPGGWSMV